MTRSTTEATPPDQMSRTPIPVTRYRHQSTMTVQNNGMLSNRLSWYCESSVEAAIIYLSPLIAITFSSLLSILTTSPKVLIY